MVWSIANLGWIIVYLYWNSVRNSGMTYRQNRLRKELEDWENYINLFHGKLSEPMLAIAMDQRKIRLDLLLKMQLEEYDRD